MRVVILAVIAIIITTSVFQVWKMADAKIVLQWQGTKNSTKTRRRTKHQTAVAVLGVTAFTREKYDQII